MGRLPSYQQSLAFYNNLMREWSPRNTVSPEKIFAKSNSKKVLWVCKTCHNEWEAVPLSRTVEKSGCPYCAGRKPLIGVNDLTTVYPEVIPLWSTRNKLPPTCYLSNSHSQVWLTCSLGHDYQRAPREFKKSGLKCKICNNRVIMTGVNDVKTTHFDLIATEWDYVKNTLDPEKLSYGSTRKAWWVCRNNHSWFSEIKSRVKGAGCPYCKDKVSPEENELFLFVKDFLPDAVQSNRRVISPYEIDVYSEERKIGFEFNGMFYHSNYFLQNYRGFTAEEFHSMKRDMASLKNIDLFFVWKEDWEKDKVGMKKAIRDVILKNVVDVRLVKLRGDKDG